MADGPVAADGVRIPIRSGRQRWLVSWHPPPQPPDGIPHGAEGVCVTADGDIVVISPDGTIWDLPAGRPEPGESWEQTLRREMDEEACATVVGVRLSGAVYHPWADVVTIIGFLDDLREDWGSEQLLVEDMLARAVAELGGDSA